MPTLKTHIAGIPHRKPLLSQLKVGDIVNLVHEPSNPHDPNAIKIICAGVPLGYIPKDETQFWREYANAKIIEIDPLRKWSEVIIEAI